MILTQSETKALTDKILSLVKVDDASSTVSSSSIEAPSMARSYAIARPSGNPNPGKKTRYRV